MRPDVLSALRCPACRGPLTGDGARCQACGVAYAGDSGLPTFLSSAEVNALKGDSESDKENSFKNYFKRWPRFYDRVSLIISPILFTGLTSERFIRRFSQGHTLLNVGSGPTRIHPDIVNVDVYAFINVDVVAKAERLPFADETFDAACSDQVLEHVAEPLAVVKELIRVTKKGGLIYAGAPFIFPLHPSPKDYMRWSKDGLVSLFEGCEVVESGVTMGPTSGMLTVFTAWLATALSFGIGPWRKALQYFFMLVLNPLKLLDLLLARLPGAETVAAGNYLIVKKL